MKRATAVRNNFSVLATDLPPVTYLFSSCGRGWLLRPRSPAAFAEIITDDLPVLHESDTLVVVLNHLRRDFVQFNLCAYSL